MTEMKTYRVRVDRDCGFVTIKAVDEFGALKQVAGGLEATRFLTLSERKERRESDEENNE